MNYTGMTLDQFLQARKLKVEKAEGEDDVSENEKMFWEYNELMKHLHEYDYFFSNENKFLLREGRQFGVKEFHMACLDVCDSPQASMEVLTFDQGLCLRNCIGKFHNWVRTQFQASRTNSLGKFVLDGIENQRRIQLGYKPREEIQLRVDELEAKINWEELNKHIY